MATSDRRKQEPKNELQCVKQQEGMNRPDSRNGPRNFLLNDGMEEEEENKTGQCATQGT